MRYTLKDYQSDAVGHVLDNLRKATRDWKQDGDTSAFSLTATTGAGKTVMAAAVIESLFNGNVEFNFEPEPGAVVLWFTDDPSLNQQTRFRLMSAADRITSSRLEVIGNSFCQEKLEAGKVYFLNSQKLSKNSLLVRGAPTASTDDPQERLPLPDDRALTMWDILRNTIEDDSLTLYLILDEAHRGMKRTTASDRAERATTVQRLINGSNGNPPIPIVWGISATIDRFKVAMEQQQNRTIRKPVEVDPARVQESGLLKDDIRLDFPAEQGNFDTSLLARATRKLRDITKLWADHAEREKDNADPVVPLLVVQVPNSPTNELLHSAFETLYDAWPELERDAVANVFGEHKDVEVGGFRAPYLPPETVQDRKHVRVLLAKDAISTGWDCPRAEVFVSFRPASDLTHITQLLGRMVRTPLARRIPGNDVLNSVSCVLPKFDKKTAKNVAKTMLGERVDDDDGTGGGDGRRVLVAPVDMGPNASIPEFVWKAFDELPSETLPRRAARPILRFTALAQALSRDKLRPDAVKEAYAELCAVLDGYSARYKDDLAAARADVQQVEGEAIVVAVHQNEVRDLERFTEVADERAIESDYKAAGRLMTPELAKLYADHLAGDDDDALLDAHITVGALGKMEGVRDVLDKESEILTNKWFSEHRVQIKGLSDVRQSVYAEIKGMSAAPQRIDLKLPRVRTEETEDLDGNKLPTRSGHLMTPEDGEFPVATLNEWEIEVLDKEMKRKDFLAWYRNPSRPSYDALAVAWRDGADNWRRMCPDFLFFHGDEKKVNVSIVDPHGHHLADSMPKLLGLAEFAEKYEAELHRIDAIAKVNGVLRVLDVTDESVREAIRGADDIEKLYLSSMGSDY